MPFLTDDGHPLDELALAQRPADGYRFELRAPFVYVDPVSGRRYPVPAQSGSARRDRSRVGAESRVGVHRELRPAVGAGRDARRVRRARRRPVVARSPRRARAAARGRPGVPHRAARAGRAEAAGRADVGVGVGRSRARHRRRRRHRLLRAGDSGRDRHRRGIRARLLEHRMARARGRPGGGGRCRGGGSRRSCCCSTTRARCCRRSSCCSCSRSCRSGIIEAIVELVTGGDPRSVVRPTVGGRAEARSR